MTIFARNTAEGGTHGVAVTSSNSGDTSGNHLITSTSGDASVTFDTSKPRTASAVSYRFACGATAGPANGRFSIFTDTTVIYGRFYLYVTGFPATHRIAATQTGTGTFSASLILRTSGKINISAADGSLLGANDMATTVPLNQWVRVEYKFTLSTTAGQGEVKLFTDPESTTPTETKTTTADQVYTANVGRAVFGNTSSTANIEFWEDDLAISFDAYVGPEAHANAGADQSVAAGTTVTLIGTPPGGTWTQESGDVVTLSAHTTDATDTRVTFTAANPSTTLSAERGFRYTVN